MTNEQIDALVELPAGVQPELGEHLEVIYLEQKCCADYEGRRWANDTDGFTDCEDNVAPTKYIRVDLVRELAEEVKRLRETWRCFHCGFETSDKTEAVGHFGEYGEEHPLCMVWGQLSDQEKINELQKIAGQLAESKEENRTLRSTIEGLEYRVDGIAAEIFSRFKGCRTIDEAWHNYDFMEGRALAAEEEVKRLREEAEKERFSTKDIIEACGGEWVLEAWDEEHPDDFPLAVMRLMRDERREQRKELSELRLQLDTLRYLAGGTW